MLRDINRSGQAPEEIIQQVAGVWVWREACWLRTQEAADAAANAVVTALGDWLAGWLGGWRQARPGQANDRCSAAPSHTRPPHRSPTRSTQCTRPSLSQTSRGRTCGWVGGCRCWAAGQVQGLAGRVGAAHAHPSQCCARPSAPHHSPSPTPATTPPFTPPGVQHLQPLLRLHEPHLHPEERQAGVARAGGRRAQGASLSDAARSGDGRRGRPTSRWPSAARCCAPPSQPGGI